MKRVILTAIAATAMFASQASAQSLYSYGAPSYGFYNSGYASPHGLYQHIGNLDGYQSGYSGYGRPIVASGYRTSFPSYVSQPYTLPQTYTAPSYAVPAATRTYSSRPYTIPAYNYGAYNYGGYGYSAPSTYNYGYATPASYRGTLRTVPYTGTYGSSYGCRC